MIEFTFKEQSIPDNTNVDYIVDGVLDLLEMSFNDGRQWLTTQEIAEFLGTHNGNHLASILRVMYKCGAVGGATAINNSTGKSTHVWCDAIATVL